MSTVRRPAGPVVPFSCLRPERVHKRLYKRSSFAPRSLPADGPDNFRQSILVKMILMKTRGDGAGAAPPPAVLQIDPPYQIDHPPVPSYVPPSRWR